MKSLQSETIKGGKLRFNAILIFPTIEADNEEEAYEKVYVFILAHRLDLEMYGAKIKIKPIAAKVG